MKKLVFRFGLAVASGLFLTGCKKSAAGGPGSAGGFPAIQVVAVEARRQAVSEILSLPGTVAANEIVEIKAETDRKSVV